MRWANDVREVHQREGTRFFLFSHEIGHLLVLEPVKGEQTGSEMESVRISPRNWSRERTLPVGPEGLRVPRAQQVSTRHDQRYILLKKFEGFVICRGEQSFCARLFENPGDYPVVEAEFDLEELSETDRELAVEGAALVWTIGYRYEGSTRKRESAIYFRRLTPWSEKEIEHGKKTAQELTRDIKWE